MKRAKDNLSSNVICAGHATSCSRRIRQAPYLPQNCMDQTANQLKAEAPKREPANPPVSNSHLGASLNADYEALRNDMEQATGLAAELQRRLSEKSNEFALFKQLFEKAKTDLAAMNTHVLQLRQERHRLANEAMRATAFEIKLSRATAERDQLRAELDTTRKGLDAACKEISLRVQKPDAIVARLAARVEMLEAQLAAAARKPDPTKGRELAGPELRAAVFTISDAVERLKEFLDPPIALPPKPAREAPQTVEALHCST